MRETTENTKEEITEITVEVKEVQDIAEVLIERIIIEGKHVIDMIKTVMENMGENEVDMRVQGGHPVCNSSLWFCLSKFYILPNIEK